MPLECQIFEKNLDSCSAFWERVAGRYRQERIFADRGGYPDKAAHEVITRELEKQDSLPYKVNRVQLFDKIRNFEDTLFRLILANVDFKPLNFLKAC